MRRSGNGEEEIVPKLVPRLGLALMYLRTALGWSQSELAAKLGVSRNLISDYERGNKPLTRERLEKLVAALGLPRDAIDDALAFVDRIRAKAGTPVYPMEPAETNAERRRIERVVHAMAEATAEVGRPVVARVSVEMRAVVDRQAAQSVWQRLLRRTPKERRSLLRKSREYRNWAVSELACQESLKAAPHSAERAVEYAELAVEIARLAPGEDLFRRRLQGYAEAHLGNAYRAHGHPRAADEAFARARPLWKAGAPGDPGLLNEARVLGLESSLRIDQRRLAEALDLLDQALAVDRNGVTKYLLINRGRALEQLGDYDGAIATLRQAAPLIDGKQEPRQLWVLQSNLIQNLLHLRRFGEAKALLPELRALAERLGQELDLLRTLWLEGWAAAGLGRKREAVAILEQVTRELTRLRIPFDAALAGLELAALYLEEGRTAEVRALADGLVAIFKAQGVHREALAALTLFYKAAAKETATVELARRLVEFLYRAQHDPELRFEAS
jgi:transcriptional regulator with XRE-family HTH domain